jgi:dephospho-CoA kinase
MIIGVTSVMGGGASTVAKMFQGKKGKLVSADAISQKILKSKTVRSRLVKAFGPSILSGKAIDRQKLAAIAFENKANLKKLNSITHPPILREARARLRKHKKGLLVLDAPLLVETGLVKEVDKVVLVKASRKARLARLEKKGFAREQALKRFKAHYSLRKKAGQADFVVDNNGSLKETRNQVNSIMEKLEVE